MIKGVNEDYNWRMDTEEERLKNLRRVREVNWAEIEAFETDLLRAKTVEEGIRDYLELMAEFGPMLRQTESIYGQEYETRLISLQEKFRKLDESRGDRVDKLINALVRIQTLLDNAGIPSAAIGGLVVGAWAKPRVTKDADLKILLRRQDRKRLLDLLAADYRSLHADPDKALQGNGIVFVLDPNDVRLDLMLADTGYDEILISRAKEVELAPGKRVRVCTAEDLIIQKIIATRPQDMVDVEAVIVRQAERLDNAYILKWLRDFEKAIDDSTLVREYQRLRDKHRQG